MAVQKALQLDLMRTSHDDENKSQEFEKHIYRTQPRKESPGGREKIYMNEK